MEPTIDIYYEYLGHIAIYYMINKNHNEFSAPHISASIGDIPININDIISALDILVSQQILNKNNEFYQITDKTKDFHNAQLLIEGSVIWKCSVIKGYTEMVLQAMYEKRPKI